MENIMWGWFRSFQRSASNLRSGALLKTAGRRLAPSLPLLFHAPELSRSVHRAQPQDSAKAPGSLSWGRAVALPSCRLQLKGWNQLNHRGFGQDCQWVLLSGLGVNHWLEPLQRELTIARFPGQRDGLLAGRVADALWSPLSHPAGLQRGNEDTVEAPMGKPHPLCWEGPSMGHAACSSAAAAHLAHSSRSPALPISAGFSSSMACLSLSLPFWGDF